MKEDAMMKPPPPPPIVRLVLRLLLSLILPVPLSISHAADSPPNVLLIISDDQTWTDFGFMGHPHIQTPHLDRLASQSRSFPNGYVPSSLCSPSLLSILTGLYPWQHRITGNEPPQPEEFQGNYHNDPRYRAQREEMIGFIDHLPTLPNLLKEKGYLSLQTGKWWMGSYRRGGFTHGMTHGDPDRGGRHGDEGLKIGREGLEPIYDFIEQAGTKPWLVWYAPFLPHRPHNPPERLLESYRQKTESIHQARYWAMCQWFDETCGALLNHLDEKKLAGNTLVIFVTDNGWIQSPDRSGYAPKSKRSPYNGGLRTPIMVRWPGRIAPDWNPSPVSSIDLAPTILDAVGLASTEEMQGVSLLREGAVANRESLFGDVYLHNAVDIHDPARNLTYRWVLHRGWKLIVPHEKNVLKARASNEATTELYFLETDPFETRNLAEDRADIVLQLRGKLESWWP